MCQGSHTVGVSPKRTISFSSPRQKPVINRIRDSMPASRNGIASSSDVTPSQRAPSSRNAREHSTAPCPYASAFTTAPTVTPAPACFSTVRKFCRKVASDLSAQVGRVGTRLRISAVVATALDYSGSSSRAQVTLGLLPLGSGGSSRARAPAPHDISVPCQREVHGDLGFHFYRLIVQDIRPVAPLAHRLNCRLSQHGMASQYFEILDRALLADHRLQYDSALNSRTSRQRGIRRLHFANQVSLAQGRNTKRSNEGGRPHHRQNRARACLKQIPNSIRIAPYCTGDRGTRDSNRWLSVSSIRRSALRNSRRHS